MKIKNLAALMACAIGTIFTAAASASPAQVNCDNQVVVDSDADPVITEALLRHGIRPSASTGLYSFDYSVKRSEGDTTLGIFVGCKTSVKALFLEAVDSKWMVSDSASDDQSHTVTINPMDIYFTYCGSSDFPSYQPIAQSLLDKLIVDHCADAK